MKQLYIIRHCSATGQHEDAPLTLEGEKQSQKLAMFLANRGIESIISSPFIRARKSIEPLARRLKLTTQIEPRLSERVLSAANLDNWMECLEHTFTDFDLRYDGGETSREAMNRATEVVQEILSDAYTTVAIVTHGNLMTLLLKYFDSHFGFEEWSQLTNPDVFLVTTNGIESKVERIWG